MLHARCTDEPVNTPGAIQQHGALLSGSLPGFIVLHASANLARHLGVTPEAALGRSLFDLLPALSPELFDSNYPEPPPVLADLGDFPRAQVFCHCTATAWYVQIEPVGLRAGDQQPPALDLSSLQGLIRQDSLPALLQVAAGVFRQLLGHHRVLIYRFHPDWHGEVVAESSADHIVTYRGRHFPAADIPAQDREHYLHEPFQHLPDTEAALIPLLSSPALPSLDLGGCHLRALPPVHLAYLRNLGVRASFVLALVVDGRLWGLVVCHHPSARWIPGGARSAATVLVGILAGRIESLLEHENARKNSSLRQHLLPVGLDVDGQLSAWELFRKHNELLIAPIDACGFALIACDQADCFGRAPSPASLLGLHAFLQNSSGVEGRLDYDQLPPELAAQPGWPTDIVGILAAHLGPTRSSKWLVFFRREWIREINWAVNPHQTVELLPDQTPFPRTSFDSKLEIKRGQSRPWESTERDYADRIAVLLGNAQLALERRRAERAERLSGAHLQSIFQALPDLIFVLDEAGRYLEVHAPVGIPSVLPGEQLVGRSIFEIMPPEVGVLYRHACQRLQAGEPLVIIHYQLDQPGSTAREFEARLIRTDDTDVLGVVRDVTEINRTQRENARLALVAQHTGSTVLFTDPQKRIVWANKAFTEVTGYTLAECLGRTPAFLQGPETSPETLAAIHRATQARTSFRGELVNYTKHGQPYWIAIEIVPHFSPQNEFIGFIGIQTDINARKRAHLDAIGHTNRLAENNRLLNVASDLARLGSWEIFADGRPPRWSELTYQIHGIPPGPPLDIDRAIDCYHPEDRARVAAATSGILASGTRLDFEARLISHPGRIVWLRACGIPVHDAAGTIIGARGFIQDITSSVLAEQTLRENEERLRTVIESLPASVFMKDGEGRLIFVNQRGLDTLGLALHSWQNKTDLQLAAELPDLAARFQAYAESDEHVWEKRIPCLVEETLSVALGQVSIHEVNKVPIFHPDGTRRLLIVVSTDITERRRNETDIRETTENLQATLDAIPSGVFFKDAEGRIRLANPSGLRLFHMQNIEWQDRTDQEIAEAHPRLARLLLPCEPSDRAAWRQQEPLEIELEYPDPAHADGSLVFHLTKVAIFHPDGTRRALLIVANDITLQRRAEEKLLLEGKREAIERLAGGVAHDFNNYLASLALSVDLLLDLPGLDPRVREIATSLNTEIDAATAVARQLLAFTKDQPIHRERFRLDHFLRDCAAFALRGSSMRSLVNVPDRDLELLADPDLLRQVLFNLILNARQAMEDKGTVLLSAGLGPSDTITLRVGDTGPGIPAAQRSNIFEPYFTTKSSGSGLGLFVVRSLLLRLGGDIRLDPTTTEGATFLISLPRCPSEAKPPAPVADDAISEDPSPACPHRSSASSRVLLLEDEPCQTHILSMFFGNLNIPVDCHADGASLLASAPAYRDAREPIICLLDITVRGGLGGLDIAAPLREILPAARIFLVSGYSAEWQEKQKSLSHLGIGFIAKPYHLSDLRERLFNS